MLSLPLLPPLPLPLLLPQRPPTAVPPLRRFTCPRLQALTAPLPPKTSRPPATYPPLCRADNHGNDNLAATCPPPPPCAGSPRLPDAFRCTYAHSRADGLAARLSLLRVLDTPGGGDGDEGSGMDPPSADSFSFLTQVSDR